MEIAILYPEYLCIKKGSPEICNDYIKKQTKTLCSQIQGRSHLLAGACAILLGGLYCNCLALYILNIFCILCILIHQETCCKLYFILLLFSISDKRPCAPCKPRYGPVQNSSQ